MRKERSRREIPGDACLPACRDVSPFAGMCVRCGFLYRALRSMNFPEQAPLPLPECSWELHVCQKCVFPTHPI